MATRFKTVEYAWDNVTTATAETTGYTSGDITLYIPETTSRVFKFAILELTCHDNEGTVADDLSVRNMGVSCNSGTNWTDRNISNTLADSGENMSYIWTADVTAELVARFGGGTSNTTTRFRCQMDYVATGNSYLNIGAKLIITYEYDDAGLTEEVKTVRIPIASNNTRLSTTAADIGNAGSQIPPLNTYLPEDAKDFKDIFFELWSNTAPSGVIGTTLGLTLDTEAEVVSGTIVNTQQSPILYRHLWKRSDITTFGSSAHVIKARHTTTGSSMFSNLGGWLTVTYTYNPTTSGSVMNSLLTTFFEQEGYVQPVATFDKYIKNLWIEEEGPIQINDCAVFVCTNATAASTVFNMFIGSGAGSQQLGSYTNNGAAGLAGMNTFVHKFGSGWAVPYGSGLTFSRGLNKIYVNWYAATASRYSNSSGLGIINYTSAITGGSVNTHNKSIMLAGSPLFDTQRAAAQTFSFNGSFSVPETNYFLNGLTYVIDTNTAGGNSGFNLQLEKTASEDGGAGLLPIYVGFGAIVAERQPTRMFAAGRNVFKRYPSDPDSSRVLMSTSHTHVFDSLNSTPVGMYNWLTYHSINYSIAGSVGSYAGAGSNIPVYAYRADNNELIGSTLTTAGGAYSIDWYDNVGSVFTEAYESGSRVGRSPNGLAS